jgi:hypothetical protein
LGYEPNELPTAPPRNIFLMSFSSFAVANIGGFSAVTKCLTC